ncbi:hypothetical protein FIBSPDRAFT_249974 [Athelia psychrophila]|uniref:Uncharacterized protein n=1 Tax=Athelia psychrophila TaxID=1759441 RepID=A0A165XWL2_9AGAM|nr:hypothetical protein FIBSPDRAFT_249974 [Fibularhizoctonia sp. CBS 109695]
MRMGKSRRYRGYPGSWGVWGLKDTSVIYATRTDCSQLPTASARHRCRRFIRISKHR